MASSAPPEAVKSFDRSLIFEYLRRQGLASRTHLASETGLSKATVTRLLNDMIREGLVEEARTVGSGLGRPHVLLRLVPRARYAVGVELTLETARVTLTDLQARPLRQRIRPVYGQDANHVIEQLGAGVNELIQDIPPAQVVGVGICAAGVVDSNTGVVNFDLSAWRDVPLVKLLQGRLGIPVSIFNRAHAAAWGEKWYGVGRQVSDLMFIRLGTVIEAGLILNNVLHMGKTFTAGALDHVTADPSGPLCTCGNHGCLHALVSTPAILARARELLREKRSGYLFGAIEGNPALLTMDHLLAAAKTGDSVATHLLAETGRIIGVVVSGILNLLNLEMVVIGGPLSAVGRTLLIPLQREVERRAFSPALSLARIELTQLGADAGVIGAASLMLRHLNSATGASPTLS